MKVITINLPEGFLEAIDALSENRSKFIRDALQQFLEKEIQFKDRLNLRYLSNLVKITGGKIS